ncbi:T9SS type A sorting domain-containing protein [Rhodohalobacter sp. SW132]|uniref:T9SS-dependent M6-like inactivated metalloprotease n=1 Tax=Rhodohalobacter sp. SW132 TaxID=2293433 RepID=UPI001314E762|nr:T9SS type A sorting domain-containing protein [Rhodohalobacter sp. SW132]
MNSTRISTVLFIFFFFAGTTIYSQTLDRSYSIPAQNAAQASSVISDGTLHIVAVMTEFQPDTNRFTSGDGTFGPNSISYLNSDEITIDPLPHNKPYFEAHLEFAKNYYSKMSSGALEIEYHVLDQVFRLPHEMKEYSPIGVDPSSEPLAELARDVWTDVENLGSLDLNLNSGDRIAFVVFHAGVGRDVELTGTILEKTPQDIPSVYISKNAFQRLFDDPSFSGFPIDNGNLIVDNTLILPRTLTRAGEDVTGSEVILQLSINGMVTAQIGSHIGLPDLFNTETGESGIGRFGLMDGAGIFAYNGLFPPELSAWEKVYMGWETPFEIDYNHPDPISLAAASLRQPNSIAKVSISASEYFLIENRHREADQTGTTLTIQRPDGTRESQTFTNADTAFVFQQSDFVELLEPGVVVDVSNYDFALPGGPAELLDETDEDDSRMLNGGILIWHIDEGIIDRQLSLRRGINDDPTRRGVHLVEADGAQDIGRPTAIGFFQNEVNGSAFDFWWSGNDASVITQTGTITLYDNRFGPDTTPNNNSNSGAKSAFELIEFSENLPTATFQIQPFSTGGDLYEVVESTQITPTINFSTPGDNPYWSRYPLSIIATGQQSELILPGSDQVLYRDHQGDIIPITPSGQNSYQQPLYNSDTETLTIGSNPGPSDQQITTTIFERSATGFTEFWNFETAANSGLISSPLSDFIQFDGTTARARISNQTIDEEYYPTAGHRSEQINGFESFISNSGEITFITPAETSTTQISVPDEPFLRKHIGLAEQQNGDFDTFLILENDLYLFRNTSGELERRTIHSSENMDWPALADIDRSGTIDFIFIDRAENQLIAKNQNGAMLSGFPIDSPGGVRFTGTPLIADLDGDGEFEIIISGQDQQSLNVYGYRSNGSQVNEFPLLVGGVSTQDDDPVHPAIGDQYLSAISPDGDLRVWRFPNLSTTLWGSKYGNTGSNKLTGRLLTETIATPDFGILNNEETYNWPNPARNETYLRFQTESPGDVQIKIATTSGRLIYERTVQSRGSGPEEIMIDTSGWGSGGYLAVVTATVNGQTERKLVKIAIAK